MKLTQKKKYFAIAGGILAVVLAFVGCCELMRMQEADALEEKFNYPGGDAEVLEIPLMGSVELSNDNNVFSVQNLAGESELPAAFDSREQDCVGGDGCVSKVENQYSESLCWAYAFTTAFESALLKQGVAAEFSAKQLDYILTEPSAAFSDSTVNNYYSYLSNKMGVYRTQLGANGNHYAAGIVAAGEYAVVDEDEFYEKMQLNDAAALGAFDTYAEYLAANGSYSVKQPKSNVFDLTASDYILTDYETIDYLNYNVQVGGGRNETREEAIVKIKNAIMNYGSAIVSSHYDSTNCMDKTDLTKMTIIDRSPNVSCTNPHIMVLVGWDDNWTYTDGDEVMQGAFLIQNSWGDTSTGNYANHLAYNSYLEVSYLTGVEENEYDDIYDMNDFQTTDIVPEDDEVIYAFHTSESQRITKVALSQFLISGSDVDFDIYISTTGDEDDFVSVGDLSINGVGMFSEEITPIVVNGDFLLKFTSTTSGFALDTTAKRNLFLGTAYANDYSNPGTTTNATLTFVSSNASYGCLSKPVTGECVASFTYVVPVGSTYEFANGKMLYFDDADGTPLLSVSALKEDDDTEWRYAFVEWDPEEGTVAGDMTFTAEFVRYPASTSTVTIDADGTGLGTLTTQQLVLHTGAEYILNQGTVYFTYDEEIIGEVTAAALDGSYFDRWEIDGAAKQNGDTGTLSANMTLTAVFNTGGGSSTDTEDVPTGEDTEESVTPDVPNTGINSGVGGGLGKTEQKNILIISIVGIVLIVGRFGLNKIRGTCRFRR